MVISDNGTLPIAIGNGSGTCTRSGSTAPLHFVLYSEYYIVVVVAVQKPSATTTGRSVLSTPVQHT